MKKKKWLGIVLALILSFGSLFQSFGTLANAQGSAKEVDTTITKFTILNSEKKETDKMYSTDSFYLSMDWDASSNGTNLHEGDYFKVKLPDKMLFPSDSAHVDFDLYAPDGKVVGKAHVTPDPKGGGEVKVTFTNYVENKYNVKGSMYLAARFDTTKVKTGEKNTFQVEIKGKVSEKTIEMVEHPDIKDEVLTKWGYGIESNPNVAVWEGRINHKKATMTDAEITDTLGDSGQTFIEDSFELRKVEFDKKGNITKELGKIDLKNKLELSADKKSYKLKLGEVNGEQYFFSYKSTYIPGTKLENKMQLHNGKIVTEVVAYYKSSESGGSGAGDLSNKIKIIKVDAENEQTKLANAEFKITSLTDGKEYTIKTDSKGEAVTDKLVAGDYKIKEIKAPNGFKLNEEEITVSVKDGQAVIKTIKDEPIKTSVSVNKKWIGKAVDSVKMHLYADGVDTGKSVVLNKDNNWKHTFDNLREFKADGTKIQYTIKEDVPPNYDSKTEGSQKDGYTVTNTNIEKIKIPVSKTWVGPKQEKVVVRLIADDKETGKEITLDESTNWKGEFTDLPKYDSKDGHEIVYTVRENHVWGFLTTITGTMQAGFSITNTISEIINIPVDKEWVGPKQKSATIGLYANGKKIDSVVLSEANNWKHEFKNIERYENGVKRVFTVKEEPMENYESEVEGDIEIGFTVRNKNTEKVKVPVEKTWIGPKQKEVTVRLFADGVEKASAKLNEANGWKHEFKDLPKYSDNGTLIKYTVKEDKVANYDTEITGDANKGFKITNKNIEKVKVPVEKTWVGPKQKEVTVRLFADDVEKDSAKLNEANNWKHEFKDLPKYNDKGDLIKYTVKEDKVTNYDTEITGDANKGFKITNKNTEKVKVPVEKTWIGPKQKEVTVRLFADDVEKASAKLNEANGWKHEFKDLPKYNDNGTLIKYTVKEDKVTNYDTEITGDANKGFKITNKNTEKVKVPVEKTWVGPKQKSVTVNLLADGVVKEHAELSEANNWKHEFTNLPKYKDDGSEIKYEIKEVSLPNYETQITGNAKDGFKIKNTNTEKTKISVDKTWVGPAKDKAVIKLLADGIEKEKVTLNKANNWKHTFDNLLKYDQKTGKEIKYEIKEETVKDYKTEITGNAKDGYKVKNTNIEKIKIPVVKKWIGKELEKVTIKLYADGKKIEEVELSKTNNWKHEFKNLPKYDEKTGKEIKYTIEENKVSGYITNITGDSEKGFTVINKEVPPAKTGDNSNNGLYGGLMAIALAGSLGAGYVGRRRKNSR